jgi:hypothetical protein
VPRDPELGRVVRVEPLLELRGHLAGAHLPAELGREDGKLTPAGECVVVPRFDHDVPVAVDPVELARVADDEVQVVADALAGDAFGEERGRWPGSTWW